jgi:hypothetical protein
MARAVNSLIFFVARNGGGAFPRGIPPDGMFPGITLEQTAMLPEMADEIGVFHANCMRGRLTGRGEREGAEDLSRRAVMAALTESTPATASRRLARASTSVSPSLMAPLISGQRAVKPPSGQGMRVAVSVKGRAVAVRRVMQRG